MVHTAFQESVGLANDYIFGILYFLLALMLASFTRFVLLKWGLYVTRKTKTDFDDKALRILVNPFSITVLLMGLQTGIDALFLVGKDTGTFTKIFTSFYFVVWLYAITRFVLLVVTSFDTAKLTRGRIHMSKKVLPFFDKIVKFFMIVVAGLALLKIWGIDITPLLASAGILGIAIAFAAKDTIANVFGGIAIFLDKTYEIGDYIEIDQQTPRGEVIDIGLRSTKIRTRDDIIITVPNSLMSTSKVLNQSFPHGTMRVRCPFGVVYGSDTAKVEHIALKTAKKDKNILNEPEPRIRLRKLGDNGLEYEFLFWIQDPSLRGISLHTFNEGLYKEFAKARVEFAFPHMELVGKKMSVKLKR